jgi:hypothetical protein
MKSNNNEGKTLDQSTERKGKKKQVLVIFKRNSDKQLVKKPTSRI